MFLCCIVPLNFVIIVNKIDSIVVVVIVSKNRINLMAINITTRIGQHKIPQRITQNQNTLTFLTTRVRAWPI